MRFENHEQSDDSVIVHHYSGNRFQGVITSVDRIWPKYQASGNVTNISYAAPAPVIPLTNEQKLSTEDMIGTRLSDWLIDTLITKGTIVVADLSAAAQTVYNDRKTLRGA